jgi:O-antigen ligase
MEVGGQPGIPARAAVPAAEASRARRLWVRPRPLRARDVQLYRACEGLTEPLIYLMVVFGPWAFGTSQRWSISLMNGAGYLLGLMLAGKLAIRWFKGYRPPRWDDRQREEGRKQEPEARNRQPETRGRRSLVSGRRRTAGARLAAVLAGLTIAILGYCLISAVNARATYDPSAQSFAYRDKFISWMPHSLDSGRSWLAFWSYLGLACSFWAIRDWLLGKSEAEERAEHRRPEPGGDPSGPFLSARLRRLLWVLTVNGGLLGVEGIAQRLEGSGKLLFLVKPRVNPGAVTQFGPYAYRANASQYFNLLWPVCLGFWWILNQSLSSTRKWHHLILACCAIMAACPMISTSRGGALITAGIIVLAAFFLLATYFLLAAHRQPERETRRATLAWLLLFFCGALVLGYALGWKALKPRMARIGEGFQYREQMYYLARPMAADYPLFGTGPGTFETVFQLYRPAVSTYWPAQLHNDWLETRITFGWLGSGLIALALAVVALRWFARGGIDGGRQFIILTWLAVAGCLTHARFDFPFQMYSIVFLFLVLCAVLVNLTRRP